MTTTSPLRITPLCTSTPSRTRRASPLWRARPSPRLDARAAARRHRRGVVAIAVAGLALGGGGGTVLASRGGAPASTPAARPATAVAATSYVVQPGDTLWSIAVRFHGRAPTMAYLDRLVDHNGGTDLAVGQRVELP